MVENRLRNMLKREVRLDSIAEKKCSGETLDETQLISLKDIDTVKDEIEILQKLEEVFAGQSPPSKTQVLITSKYL